MKRLNQRGVLKPNVLMIKHILVLPLHVRRTEMCITVTPMEKD